MFENCLRLLKVNSWPLVEGALPILSCPALKSLDTSWVQRFTLVVLTCRRLEQEDCKFETGLGHIARAYLKKKKKKRQPDCSEEGSS